MWKSKIIRNIFYHAKKAVEKWIYIFIALNYRIYKTSQQTTAAYFDAEKFSFFFFIYSQNMDIKPKAVKELKDKPNYANKHYRTTHPNI